MALIEIHIHGELDNEKLDKIISKIFKIEIEMAKTKDELKAEFASGFGELKTSLANIAADIDRLIAGTEPQGGLTEAEVEEQLTELRSVSAALKLASEKVPEPPVEPLP